MLRKIKSALKTKYKKYIFFQNAHIGNHFECDDKAVCVNGSGVKENITIADNCAICGTLITNKYGKISIGEYTTIRYNSSIESGNEITIGNHVIISNNVIIRDNNSHPSAPEKRIQLCESGFESALWGWEYADGAPIVIEDNVWIGERVMIYKGVNIGKGSIIGGGAVVTKSIPEYSVAVGNPARVVKSLK